MLATGAHAWLSDVGEKLPARRQVGDGVLLRICELGANVASDRARSHFELLIGRLRSSLCVMPYPRRAVFPHCCLAGAGQPGVGTAPSTG